VGGVESGGEEGRDTRAEWEDSGDLNKGRGRWGEVGTRGRWAEWRGGGDGEREREGGEETGGGENKGGRTRGVGPSERGWGRVGLWGKEGMGVCRGTRMFFMDFECVWLWVLLLE